MAELYELSSRTSGFAPESTLSCKPQAQHCFVPKRIHLSGENHKNSYLVIINVKNHFFWLMIQNTYYVVINVKADMNGFLAERRFRFSTFVIMELCDKFYALVLRARS